MASYKEFLTPNQRIVIESVYNDSDARKNQNSSPNLVSYKQLHKESRRESQDDQIQRTSPSLIRRNNCESTDYLCSVKPTMAKV